MSIRSAAVDEAALQMQLRMDKLLETACNGDQLARRHLFGLRMLVSLKFTNQATREMQAEHSLAPVRLDGPRRLETARVLVRVNAMHWLHELISYWPQSFHQMAVDMSITQRTFSRARIEDAWLLSEVQRLPVGQRRKRGNRLDAVHQALRMPLRNDIGNWRAARALTLMRQAGRGH